MTGATPRECCSHTKCCYCALGYHRKSREVYSRIHKRVQQAKYALADYVEITRDTP